jgi:hypothetical protein
MWISRQRKIETRRGQEDGRFAWFFSGTEMNQNKDGLVTAVFCRVVTSKRSKGWVRDLSLNSFEAGTPYESSKAASQETQGRETDLF